MGTESIISHALLTAHVEVYFIPSAERKKTENVFYKVASKNEMFADPDMDNREVLRTIRKRAAALRNS